MPTQSTPSLTNEAEPKDSVTSPTSQVHDGKARPSLPVSLTTGNKWQWGRRIIIVLLPVLGILLVAPRYNKNWYFYDEWSMIERVLSTTHNLLHGAVEPYNGHLYIICYFTYKAQLALGLTGHTFLWVLFCSSLLLLDISLALLLYAAGVPALIASVAGIVMTYFGPGAQLMTFEFQFTMDAAIALPLLAAYFVLRYDDRRLRGGTLIAATLLLSVIFDSATASAGLLFVAILLLLMWRDRWALVAISPSVAISIAFLLGNHSTILTAAATASQEALFGVRLLLRALGGLVGGGEVAGGILLVISVASIVVAAAKHLFSQKTLYVITAGATSGLAMDAVTAWSRAGLVGDDFFDFNRYISLVAVYLLVALLPAAVALLRALPTRSDAFVEPTFAGLLVTVFILNLGPLTHYRNAIESWMAQTHALVPHVLWAVGRGCPAGRHLDAAAEPLGTLDPQITVGLLLRLEQLGSLKPPLRPSSNPVFVAPTAWRAAASICSANAIGPPAK